MSKKSCANWHGEPSTTKNSSSSRAPKNWRSTQGDNPEERENDLKWPKNPFIAAITAINGNPVLNAVSVSVARLECTQNAAMN